MSQNSNTNKKSQFPPRKKSPPSSSTSSESQTINCKECIINYQKDIQLLKGRIQELENHLDKLSEPDTELIQLYQLAQVEWNKLSDENSKLRRLVKNDKTQNLSSQEDTKPSLIQLENQRLRDEIEKKNAIIREMANQPFFTSSLNDDENQIKKLTIENMRLKNELQNANLALQLNGNVMSLDMFNKILADKQKTKVEPNEEIKLLQEENKSLRIQVSELESEIYEVSNNNPELQASLEAERQLRKLNRELEHKINKLEIQLKSGNIKQQDQLTPEKVEIKPDDVLKKPPKKRSQFDDFDDFLDDDELFKNEIDSLDDDGFESLKNTSDEDDEGEELKKKNKNKEFELSGDMAMFSAILAPLKKKLDERCRQIEIEKMKEKGVFAPINSTTNEKEKEDENGLGVDIIDEAIKEENKSNENDNE